MEWYKLIVPAYCILAATIGFSSYGWYELLRWVVAIQAAITATSYAGKNNIKCVIYAIIGLLFFPALNIRFHRSEWQVIDFIVAIILAAPTLYKYYWEKKTAIIDVPQHLKADFMNHLSFMLQGMTYEYSCSLLELAQQQQRDQLAYYDIPTRKILVFTEDDYRVTNLEFYDKKRIRINYQKKDATSTSSGIPNFQAVQKELLTKMLNL